MHNSHQSSQSRLRELFLDAMGGGAWPFLVGGAICLVNSVNERDLALLVRAPEALLPRGILLEGPPVRSKAGGGERR